MSSNVGLTTPRGSGTSGYVQRNLSHLRPREKVLPPRDSRDGIEKITSRRKPDEKILAHQARREVEVKVFDLQEELEEKGVAEEEIERRTSELRTELTSKQNQGSTRGDVKGLKKHQTHELARAKEVESERLRRALGIRDDRDDRDGPSTDRARNEKRRDWDA